MLTLSKKQDFYLKTIITSIKFNINLVNQNTHKLAVTSKLKKQPYFKTKHSKNYLII